MAEYLHPSSGGPGSHNSCWDFYFKEKDERRSRGRKGGKVGAGELRVNERDGGDLASPHWAPAHQGRPPSSCLPAGQSKSGGRKVSVPENTALLKLDSDPHTLPQRLSRSIFSPESKKGRGICSLNFPSPPQPFPNCCSE